MTETTAPPAEYSHLRWHCMAIRTPAMHTALFVVWDWQDGCYSTAHRIFTPEEGWEMGFCYVGPAVPLGWTIEDLIKGDGA